MKLYGNMTVFVYKKKEKSFESGRQELKYYRLLIDVNDEVDEIPCSEEVFRAVETGKMNALSWVYDSQAERNPFKFTAMYVANADNSKDSNKVSK